MKKKWKTVILLGLLVLIAGAVFASIKISQRGVVIVQTGKVTRMDLTSVVTASGEIKPRNYINIGTNAIGGAPITAIYVKEGDHVKKGQVLARLASVQPSADVESSKAIVNSALADSAASEAAVKSAEDNIAVAQAQVDHDRADLEQKKIDLQRAQQLYDAKLIASQDFEAKKAAYDLAKSTVEESERRVTQAQAQKMQSAAQLASAQKKVSQAQAMVTRSENVLSQYEAVAPLDGVVTNLPVRVGETVVPGIQNSPSSTIMTIADMSIITAEVHVDETDIVSVRIGEPADVTIDAIPNRTFKGKVIEIGDTAIVRSSGVAASQSQTSAQEAKDFKVVIALDIPESLVRPGLSCTAKITTATRSHILSIPMQALTMRQKGQLEEQKLGQKPRNEPLDPAAQKAAKEELQGVFVVNSGKAEFRKVETGITGLTDIEVVNGLKEGDEIVTGSYQVIRTIRNEAKVKVDNKPPVIAPQPS
ncbi:MAG: efflux RND transporter periplasmic adaptor subunit [Acidobacteriaceae bacterium]|nr:efflux RND transporter periplasmic adaptor subunit [Acidobacteriaceae bacterium]MBV9781875.1 efflux RND transporter periplasmic adaptor subunit [Acidobacteriaceae bacterium]